MWWKDLLLFLFPGHCLVCGRILRVPGECLCLSCEYQLPRTAFLDKSDNPVFQNFWGRIPVEMASSLLRFEKGSAYQQLIHEMKYRQNRKAGIALGLLMGIMVRETVFATCDVIIPVPLHPRRQRRRGFNQSELLALGIHRQTGIPVCTSVLLRTTHHPSQTSLGRYDRYCNVSDKFSLSPGSPGLDGKRVLLVDDVITTGSTLEACGRVLLRHFSCKLYFLSACCA